MRSRNIVTVKNLIQKLIHKLKSHPQKGFGIHSPFVFHFQREVLHPNKGSRFYGEYAKEQDKVVRLLLRMRSYFNLDCLLILGDNYQRAFENYAIPYDTELASMKKYDWVLLNTKESFDVSYLADEAFVVLIGDRDREALLENTLRKKCNVFLDLYEIAICVFNNGLSKQEFKLKL